MANTRAMALLIAMLALFALLLAGCSGSFRADDEDDDEDSDTDVTFEGDDEDEDDNDAPGAALGVIVTSLGLAGALRRRLH